MTNTHLSKQSDVEPTPRDKFVKGLQSVFGTTKTESDRQLEAAAQQRKAKRATKTAKK